MSFAAWVAGVIQRGQSQEAFARDVGVSLHLESLDAGPLDTELR
jgi:hypothetical protein